MSLTAARTTLRPIPMDRLLEHISREMEMTSTVFSVTPGYRGSAPAPRLPFGGLELPLGVAAGPHGQMAQNLAAAYVAGARFLELAPVDRNGGPSGLTLDQARDEAIKGAVLVRLLARELGLGDPAGACFAMTVSGDRRDLSGPGLGGYFDALADAGGTPLWEECRQAALRSAGRFYNLEKEDIRGLDPHISSLVTLRPVGGTADWEAAAAYLLEERGLHTYLRLDLATPAPALEELLDLLGRLKKRADGLGLVFGARLAGKLPPAEEEALTGASLCPLALDLAAQIARAVPGLPITYAGGADNTNLRALYEAGLQPICVAATLGKPGGYLRLRQMAKTLSAAPPRPFAAPDPEALEALGRSLTNTQARRPAQPPVRRRMPGRVPMLDCFAAPCAAGCPFGEDIAGYLRLMSDGRYRDALRVILDRNPLPHLTGALCPEPCRESCTRLFYDEAVRVRDTEALCAHTAWNDLLPRLEPQPPHVGCRVAVLGATPGGMALTFLLARRGVAVTLFDESPRFCPDLRAQDPRLGELADRDGELLTVMEADLRLGEPLPAPRELLRGGYSHAVLARDPALPGPDQLRLSPGEPERLPANLLILDQGPSVAHAIAAAHALCDSLLGPAEPYPHPAGRRGGAMGKKGKLCPAGAVVDECERCLECATVCECCVDVCPNRANVPITVLTRGKPEILHLDGLCDGCGVCAASCPFEGAPFRDKFTLYETVEDFAAGENNGFVVLDFLSRKVRLRLDGQERDASLRRVDRSIPARVQELMETIFADYPYLLDARRRMEVPQVSLWEQ